MNIVKTVCLLLLVNNLNLFAQVGPVNAGTTGNNAAIGTNIWSNPASARIDNGNRATVATKGITNYVTGTNFGFAVPVPSSINGIELEIDRSTTSSTAVAILENWTTATTTIAAGVARCLIACVVTENGLGPRQVTSLTYGGQAMTLIARANTGTLTGFYGNLEYWRLGESGIAAATGTAFVASFTGVVLLEDWSAISSAVFQFVDQGIPVSASQSFSINANNNPITLNPAIATRVGGITLSAAFCGNNTAPASTPGGTNTYSINSGFTEVIDTYSANALFSTSGGCFQIAHKLSVAAATEAPTYTFNGTPNRSVLLSIHLQSLREADHSVRLIKNGTITGNDYAQTTFAWPSADAYAVYGGPTDTWGTTWTDADINSNNFGAALSASVQNGTARVDNIRITVYFSSALPVELMDFSAQYKDGKTFLQWQTATEKNNKEFVIQRSSNMIDFENIAVVKGNGTSSVFNNYSHIDETSFSGNIYYRLKQIDFDGTFCYSKNIVISKKGVDEFIVYPNPSAGKFCIAGNQATNQGLTVYDASFKLVKIIEGKDADKNFSLEDQSDGVYYLVYTNGTEQKIKKLEKSSRTN